MWLLYRSRGGRDHLRSGGDLADSVDVEQEVPVNTNGHIASEELGYRLRQQRLTADFGAYALRTDNLADLLQESTRVTAQGLNVAFSKVLEHRSEGGFLVVAGVGWRDGIVGVTTVGEDLESPAGFAYHTEKPVISNHLENEQRFRTPPMLVEHGIRRAINVIIRTDGHRYGVLEADTPDQGKFEEADVAFMEGFATLLGLAIHRAQREVEMRSSEARLQTALQHQEVLTQEISHRVKNSLAAVGGLLAMQARTTDNDVVKNALGEAGNRVNTIAAIHDRLWRQKDLRSVRLREFVDDLCEQFRTAVSSKSITCTAPDIVISADKAITLGLLANELVTNAFKYAYDGGDGPVALVMIMVADSGLRLEVIDHGRGMPRGFDASTNRSLGIRLVRSLSQELGGTPEWLEGGPGTTFRLEFHAE